jgi:hypothetical protein
VPVSVECILVRKYIIANQDPYAIPLSLELAEPVERLPILAGMSCKSILYPHKLSSWMTSYGIHYDSDGGGCNHAYDCERITRNSHHYISHSVVFYDLHT